MAEAAKSATARTTLVIGKVQIPVALFTTKDKPGKLAEFSTAGPHGGKLKAEYRARPVDVTTASDDGAGEPVHSDPLADEPLEQAVDPVALNDAKLAAMVPAVTSEAIAEGEAFAASVASDPETGEPSLSAVKVENISGVEQTPDPDMAARLIGGMLDHAPPALAAAQQVDGEYGQVLVEDGTGDVVLPEQVRRGIRLDDGSFIDCTEQLAQIDADTRLTQMVVAGFVDITSIPRSRVQASYYVGVGDEKADAALRLLFEALKLTRRGAVVKATKKSRQSLGVIGWLGDSLMFYELVWSEDMRPAPARASRIRQAVVTEAQVARMCELVQAMSVPPGVLDDMRDDALARREELRAAALAGEVESIAPAPVQTEDDVLAQLEASLAAVVS